LPLAVSVLFLQTEPVLLERVGVAAPQQIVLAPLLMTVATGQAAHQTVILGVAVVLLVALVRAETLLQALAEPAMLALAALVVQRETQAVTAANMVPAMAPAVVAAAILFLGTARTAVCMGLAVAAPKAQATKAATAGRG
jgi:hydrogenase-4 membrane subunit HyfE